MFPFAFLSKVLFNNFSLQYISSFGPQPSHFFSVVILLSLIFPSSLPFALNYLSEVISPSSMPTALVIQLFFMCESCRAFFPTKLSMFRSLTGFVEILSAAFLYSLSPHPLPQEVSLIQIVMGFIPDFWTEVRGFLLLPRFQFFWDHFPPCEWSTRTFLFYGRRRNLIKGYSL